MLVATEVMGVAEAEAGRAEVASEVASEEGALEDAAPEELAGWEAAEVARPVTVEIVGFEDAWFEPIVA